jgi:hypothetical protein
MEHKYIEVFVQHSYSNGSIEIWVTQERNDGRYNLHFDGENIEYQKLIPHNITEGLKPLLFLPREIAMYFLKELAIQAKYNGVRPENESRVEGKLEATLIHLEDMRKIVGHIMKIPPFLMLGEKK